MPGCPQIINVEVDGDAQLFGDEADIQSVLTNLVSNAVRYTPEDGELEIRWVTDEDGGHLIVSDSGTGISRAHFPRLTERFYRVEDGRQRIGGEGGTGLGLAIVKHALHRHEATLDIESELGVGSQFICNFPVERIVAVA
jgi:two-component system phosphate regulon sensor histidine kinase PhoR